MTVLRSLAASFLVTLAVWACFSWPLPVHVTEGISSTARNVEEQSAREMIPGDHLQLLYHFRLAADFAAGKIPLFHNVYEFNTGSDEERYQPGPYYAPFSLLFALLKPVGGEALAWNLTGMVSLWLTFWATLLLVRRYVPDPWTAWCAASLGILLPYRWISLGGGSPAGFGMMWIPLVFLGLEMMAVDRKARGGLLAGLSIYFSSWADTHVFFFAVLAAPVWILFSYLVQRDRWIPRREEWAPLLRSASPLLASAVLVALQVLATKKRLAGTGAGAAGRSLKEVLLFSPPFQESLLFWDPGRTGETYLGIVMVLLTVSGAAAASAAFLQRRAGRRTLFSLAALTGLVAAAAVLASGPRGPLGPEGWSALRALVPPYAMVRQPAKGYCLRPTALSVAAALSLKALFGGDGRGPLLRRGAPVAVAALLFFDYRIRIDTMVSLLASEQGAYRAVAEDAAAAGLRPHLLALPLWPGDSHWTSVNQHYVSLYGLRMVNGYRPYVPSSYIEKVFRPLERFNKGSYPDRLLDDLLAKEIHYLVLHEDAFPEKVSPFGVSHTLQALFDHRRIRPLASDGPAWAFRVLATPGEASGPSWTYRAPTRIWEADKLRNVKAVRGDDPSAGNGRYLRLTSEAGAVATPSVGMYALEGLQFQARVRGEGPLELEVLADGESIGKERFILKEKDWIWHALPVPADLDYARLALRAASGGQADLDLIGLVCVPWSFPPRPEPLRVPAPVFFHAGFTEIERGEVVLSPERDPADVVFYGPRLPLKAGKYRVEVAYRSPAPPGTLLGEFFVRYPTVAKDRVPLSAGEPFTMTYLHPEDLPVSLGFDYAGTGVVRIREVSFQPLE
jgi:hypothetical protein